MKRVWFAGSFLLAGCVEAEQAQPALEPGFEQGLLEAETCYGCAGIWVHDPEWSVCLQLSAWEDGDDVTLDLSVDDNALIVWMGTDLYQLFSDYYPDEDTVRATYYGVEGRASITRDDADGESHVTATIESAVLRDDAGERPDVALEDFSFSASAVREDSWY